MNASLYGVHFSPIISFALSCGGAALPVERGASHDVVLSLRDLAITPGANLTNACVPTGIERCFNAIDDNCNGVVDEGCGLPTGPLQFLVAWGSSPANVDLELVVPGGEIVGPKAPAVAGFRYDRDCPTTGCNDQNYENLYFNESAPPRGRYRLRVVLTEPRGTELPLEAHVALRVGNRSYSSAIKLTDPKARVTYEFELP